MTAVHLIYPMFAMVLLTFVVLIALFRGRVAAVKAGSVNANYFRIYQGAAEPAASAQLSRHFANLFEAPVLFYAVCLAGLVLRLDGWLLPALAWAYVLLRVVHAIVHTGRNRLRSRMAAYFSGWLVLLAMWTYVAIAAAAVAGTS